MNGIDNSASMDYLFLTLFAVAALAFCLIPLGLAKLWARYFSKAKPGKVKNATYECGLESKGDAWLRFSSEYYIYALVFLIFDIEVAFLIPFAVAFTELPFGAFLAISIFILLLVEGLVWAWKKGALLWV